jgi:hypothetical protein
LHKNNATCVPQGYRSNQASGFLLDKKHFSAVLFVFNVDLLVRKNVSKLSNNIWGETNLEIICYKKNFIELLSFNL